MDKRYCIFDLDGTLVDSMKYWRSLGRDYLISRGITNPSREVLRRTRSLTMLESAQLFIDEFGMTESPAQLVDGMHRLIESHYRHRIPLKPGVQEYIRKLREQGARLCVATATAEPLAWDCLKRLGIASELEFLLSCETLGKRKTEPDIYLAAAARFGAEPGDCAVFEDVLFAGRTAKEAGFYLVGVQDASSASEWEAITALADECITDWRNLV